MVYQHLLREEEEQETKGEEEEEEEEEEGWGSKETSSTFLSLPLTTDLISEGHKLSPHAARRKLETDIGVVDPPICM